MISQRRKAGLEFEKKLHNRGLHRIRVRWVDWDLEKGRASGVTAASPQFPPPFGPPIRLAMTLDDEMVIQPANEKERERFLFELIKIPAWDGLVNMSHLEKGEWLKIPSGRETTGRYMVFENIEGRDFPIYGIFAVDGGPVALNDLVANVVCSSFDAIDDAMKANEARYKDAEIVAGVGFGEGGGKGTEQVIPIKRDYEQQQWRAETEDKIADLARADYHFRYSKYQAVIPDKESSEGVLHPAGFRIIDRRSHPQSGLAEKP